MASTKLQQAVIAQLGEGEEGYTTHDMFRDVCEHGADTGWNGFTYHSETCEFFEANQAEIVALVKEMADDQGVDPISLVASFRCVDDDRETRDEIGRCIYGKPTEDDVTIPNALAWFALEEVARQVVDA